MAIIFELEEDQLDPHGRRHMLPPRFRHGDMRWAGRGLDKVVASFQQQQRRSVINDHEDDKREEIWKQEERSNPNANRFTAALTCYPVISQIAQSLDLNTLHALSLTCRQIRANILPYRRELVKRTLRCERDCLAVEEVLGARGSQTPGAHVKDQEKLPQRRARCARDLVGDCRRCGRIICRNCISKPPSSSALADRHRRLCPTCNAVPLTYHTHSPFTAADLHSRWSFTSPAFVRGPCCCADAVWLCQPCGQSLRTADTTYMRVWTWRTRYSTYLGGLGTGIGEGNEGVKCGREQQCLAAREVEVEVDCEAEDLAANAEVDDGTTMAIIPAVTATSSTNSLVDESKETGYLRQEIEGIGGVVKKKLKIRVKVGAVVEEWEDERECAGYLTREMRGEERSWCAWCQRVVPGIKDRDVKDEFFERALGGTNV